MSGKPKSIKTTSGVFFAIIDKPSFAFSLSPITSISSLELSAHLSPTLVNLKSSTITTEIVSVCTATIFCPFNSLSFCGKCASVFLFTFQLNYNQ